MQPILPWHQSMWQYLVDQRNIGKLPHALLIQGLPGVGKTVLAKNLAALLLCQKSLGNNIFCGECSSCILLQADNHPDFILVQPEEQRKAIKIDQIREIIVELNNTSHQGGMKVVIIESAELLGIAAANALLKTLEEPATGTLLVLISSYPLLLPATIRSRCQMVSIDIPEYSIACNWLKQEVPGADIELLLSLAENAPLKALGFVKEGILQKRQEFFNNLYALQESEISLEQMITKSIAWGLDNLIITFMYIINDLVKCKLAVAENIINKDQKEKLCFYASKINMDKLLYYRDKLYELRTCLMHKINLNQQLVIENLIISWLQICEGV
ncbi:MAG: DNA polymerase III subunit delta' [Coxiellaceae bacterium]|jgi:DNA polymerase-3 subunit delta'|nr:DNA polymerase III subunit delta' [Coxiellaceae bacterium]